MPTPSGVTIKAILPDGSEVDVTEGVQVLYDGVISSMDWGSGFWSKEDAVPVAEIAEVCGFERADEPARYLRDYRVSARAEELRRQGMGYGESYRQAEQEVE